MIQGNWYDYPQYYDMAFRCDNAVEGDFLEAVWERYAEGPVRRVLEPGCGSGRLVVELASRGYAMVGFDLNDPSLRYLRKRLRRRGLEAETFQGDMTDFELDEPVDAAFCLINTFRHLPSDKAAHDHLQCVARALRPGGLYVLGFHLMPPDVAEECIERWYGKHGKTRVTYTLRVLEFNRRKRMERWRISMLAHTPRGKIRCATECAMRIYNARQWQRVYESVPELELVEILDFEYDLETPRELDDELADAVFIFRKR